MGDKCERYRKRHESHYIYGPSLAWNTLHYNYTPWPVGNETHAFAVLLALIAHPTSGGTRTKHSTAVVQTVTASVTVWLRETTLRYCSHLSPTLLPGERRTKRSTAVVQTVIASVTVWLRETTYMVQQELEGYRYPCEKMVRLLAARSYRLLCYRSNSVVI